MTSPTLFPTPRCSSNLGDTNLVARDTHSVNIHSTGQENPYKNIHYSSLKKLNQH